MNETYTLEGCLPILEDGKAVLVDVPDLGGWVWIPKRVISEDSEVRRPGDERGDLVVDGSYSSRMGWL